jgi:hypothetical protein
MRLIEGPMISDPPAAHRAYIARIEEAARDYPDYDYSWQLQLALAALEMSQKWACDVWSEPLESSPALKDVNTHER